MRQPRDQHWADLVEALEIEADLLGGFGEITVRIQFHQAQPREVRVCERRATYQLGQTAPPLRGGKPSAR